MERVRVAQDGASGRRQTVLTPVDWWWIAAETAAIMATLAVFIGDAVTRWWHG